MNKIIKKQVLATFALVTIMAGVLIRTNCIYAAAKSRLSTHLAAMIQLISHQMPEAYTKWMLPEQPSPERNSPDILRDWSAKIQEYL